MKRCFATVVLTTLALAMARAIVFEPVGPVGFKFNAITQQSLVHEIQSKTNQTATATSITTVSKATIATAPFASSNLIALLANSFNTNFPAGAQIGMRSGNLVVVDDTGTNVLFDPSPVLTTGFQQAMQSAIETETSTGNPTGPSRSGTVSEIITSNLSINYDDTDQNTSDSTHTEFQLKGLFVQKVSQNLKTGSAKITSTFQGTGGGQLRGVTTILTGTITSNAAGIAPPM